MPEEILIKILNNSATEAEKNQFFQELQTNDEMREAYYHYKKLYTVTGIDYQNQNNSSAQGFEKFWNRLNPEGKSFGFIAWFRYAAIILVSLSLGFMVQYLISANKPLPVYTHQIEYTSEKGAVSTIHLDDGSSIWLSSGSKIILCKKSTGEMTARLNGEAYFDMVPDPKRNFVVDLGFFKVRDIGTKFDIRAYSSEQAICASLIDGRIDFCKQSEKTLLSLQPGEYMQFDKKSNHIKVVKQDPSIATAWKDGKFVFIHKTLSEICRDLESWYNVQIIISNKTLANTRYTSVIKRTTTVKLVLNMLSLTDKINYTITDRKEAKDIVYIY